MPLARPIYKTRPEDHSRKTMRPHMMLHNNLALCFCLRVTVEVVQLRWNCLVAAVMMSNRIDSLRADLDPAPQPASPQRCVQHVLECDDIDRPILLRWPPIAQLGCRVDNNIGFSHRL